MKHYFLVAVLVACGGNRVEDSGAAQAGPSPQPKPQTPATTPPPPTPPAKAAPMTTFMPTIKFREHAAKLLGVPAADIEGGAVDAADAADTVRPETVGGAWGYTVH